MQYCWSALRSSRGSFNLEDSINEWLSEVDRIRGRRPYDDPELLDVLHLYSFNNGMGVKRCRFVWEPESENPFNQERDPFGKIKVVNLPILLEMAQKEGLIKDYAEAN